jgi:hypothetical protein
MNKRGEEKNSLFSNETLDSIAMAEIYGGEGEPTNGYCASCPTTYVYCITNCACPAYDICCTIGYGNCASV